MKWMALLLCMLAVPAVRAEPWLCVDEHGHKAFSYEPESARNKNCVHHPIPSGNVWRVRPRTTTQQQQPSFPRVDARTQKQRDVVRREILQRELQEEKKALAAAITELAQLRVATVPPRAVELKRYEDRIRVHQTNIANLQKELGAEG